MQPRPHLTRPFAGPLATLVTRVRAWPVASQQQARRNAMVAATSCAQRRAEREEVADYLAARAAPTTPAAVASPGPRATRRAHG